MPRHSEIVTCFLPQRWLQALAVPIPALALALAVTSAAGAATGPTPTERPHVAGDAIEGARLVAFHGTWSGKGPVKYI
jgi:hypothetical protein